MIAKPCSPADMFMVLHSVVELTVGPVFRLSAEESRHFLVQPAKDSVYSLEPGLPLRNHSACCERLFFNLLDSRRLEQLELMRQQSIDDSSSSEPPRPGTFDILTELAFGPGHSCQPLLHPLTRNGTACSHKDLSWFGKDPLRAEARLKFAMCVAGLQNSRVHASVRAGAEGFAASLRRVEKTTFDKLTDDVAAPWLLFMREIVPEGEDTSLMMGSLPMQAGWCASNKAIRRPSASTFCSTFEGSVCARFGCSCGQRARL